jgi:hypothetical protein
VGSFQIRVRIWEGKLYRFPSELMPSYQPCPLVELSCHFLCIFSTLLIHLLYLFIYTKWESIRELVNSLQVVVSFLTSLYTYLNTLQGVLIIAAGLVTYTDQTTNLGKKIRVRKIDSKFWSQFSLVGKFCKSQATFL